MKRAKYLCILTAIILINDRIIFQIAHIFRGGHKNPTYVRFPVRYLSEPKHRERVSSLDWAACRLTVTHRAVVEENTKSASNTNRTMMAKCLLRERHSRTNRVYLPLKFTSVIFIILVM